MQSTVFCRRLPQVTPLAGHRDTAPLLDTASGPLSTFFFKSLVCLSFFWPPKHGTPSQHRISAVIYFFLSLVCLSFFAPDDLGNYVDGRTQVAKMTVMTEYMVVLEGNSRPQNQAIAQNIEEKMEEVHQRKAKSQVRFCSWLATNRLRFRFLALKRQGCLCFISTS